jgi:hypothetical protein
MPTTRTAPGRRLALSVLIALAACGARDGLHKPLLDGGTAPDAGRPPCLIECTIDHACCLGGCDGPATVTGTCCSCLPGEVSSTECGAPTCGGG